MPKPYYEDDAVTIYHGDAREILPSLPQVDLVLTDPPYGVNTDSTRFTDSARGVRGYEHLRKPHPALAGWEEVDLETLFRHSAQIIWSSNHFKDQLPSGGGWLVWDKRAHNGHSLLSDGELAWMSKGTGVKIFDHVWHGFARASENSEHYHPTQKPVALMKWCLHFFPNARTVLDPFMGSGTTLRAAKDLGRKAIGIEIEERYCEIAANRMAQSVMDLAT